MALFTSAMVAGLVAFKNGYTAARFRDAAIGGVTSAMGAIFILLAVGALIGTWNMAGTIPTVVSYGVRDPRRAIFFAAVALICAVVGAVTGSSWTTAATLGVAFVGMAPVLGMSTTIAAGAVISGAYVGDKMSPLSETTILVPTPGGRGVGHRAHQGHGRDGGAGVRRRASSSISDRLTVDVDADPTSVEAARRAIAGDGVQDLAAQPAAAVALVVLTCARSHRTSASSASRSARECSPASPSPTSSRRSSTVTHGPARDGVEAVYAAMANGFESTSGNATIDDLFTGGGMSSMLTTVWLILAALSFAAIMEEAGFLNRLIEPIVIGAPHRCRAIRRSPAPPSGSTSSPATSTSPWSYPAGSSESSSRAAGWPPGCCRERSRTPARSRRRSCRGTAAAPT